MTTHTLPIVGAHFRPPAKALISVLPAKAKLSLVPEGVFGLDENPYDVNAVGVWVETSQIPSTQAEVLEGLIAGNGLTLEDVLGHSAFQLGYIPAKDAAPLRATIIENCNAFNTSTLPGELGFSLDGKPQVKFALYEKVEVEEKEETQKDEYND